MNIVKISGMPLVLPEHDIYARLGYNRFKTELDPAARLRIDGEIRRAFALARPVGVWRVLPREACMILLDNPDIAARYGECPEIWLGAVTIGPALPDAALAARQSGDSARSVIFDAVGSETADEAMNFLQNSAAAALRRRGGVLTERRFSPGYGSLPLSVQPFFFDQLDVEAQLGVRLSERRIMSPEKSVTALAGVFHPAP